MHESQERAEPGGACRRTRRWKKVLLLPILDRCSGAGRKKASNRSDWAYQSDDAKRGGTKEAGFHFEAATQLERLPDSFSALLRGRGETLSERVRTQNASRLHALRVGRASENPSRSRLERRSDRAHHHRFS